jgi:membrane-anchored protein YejM (alkaline phosphatase superfamily)
MVQEVLTALSKKKLLDNTIVIITGDHGQEFNDLKLNYWGHTGNFSRYQTQTPLVIHWPGKNARTFTQTTSHLDIAPTLMTLMLSCNNDPAKYSNGRSLLDTAPRPYVLASSWDTFGIIEPDRTTVSLHAGDVEILDKDYRPIKGAKIRSQITQSAMEGIGKFFAR